MTYIAGTGLFWALAVVALVGALTVVFAREVMRMALGLGAFLIAVAGFFAYYGFGFLALAEMFVYVGGVLVLVLFAIMFVQRSGSGAPVLESRIDLLAVVSAAGVAAMLYVMVRPLAQTFSSVPIGSARQDLAQSLLDRLLPQFEAVGLLLLVSLVAVVVIVGGERE